jgi:hypothetical protein
VADIDGVDVGIAHQAADQADDAVGGQDAGGRIGIARRFRALHIVHRFDEIVDAERYCRHQDDAEIFETGKHHVGGGQRHREAEACDRLSQPVEAEAAVIEAEQVRAPRDRHADDDSDEPGGDLLWIFHATEPAHHDDGEAGGR